MILSASRRTDLPAFYSDWFLRRLAEGYVLVRNPMNPSRVSKIALSPELVDCIVFWTKNPAPMLGQLQKIRDMGHEFYFQFTLNPYGEALERRVPSKAVRLETFHRLSRAIGRKRLVWRYDPVILNEELTPEWHLREFRKMCEAIANDTEECIFSFVDIYHKMASRSKEAVREITLHEMDEIALGFSRIAQTFGLTLKTCSESIDLSKYGIKHARCIDPERIERLIGCPIRGVKDKNQRPECGCMQSIDIGAYNTCRHGCLYCYACAEERTIHKATEDYNPASPLLTGSVTESDQVFPRTVSSLKETQLTLL